MNIIGISGLHNSVSFKKKKFPHLTPRQYRIAQGLDAAAALVSRGGIEAAVAEERFTGEKGTGSFPICAIRYCLQAASITLNEIDYIAHSFSYEPVRDLFDYSEFTQRQFQEVYSREAQLFYLRMYFPTVDVESKFVQVPHHLAHAASAFYPSRFKESLIVVADGMGELHSLTVAIGTEDNITILKQIPALHSLGILYGICTLYLGFYMGFDEYKVMGLAPYGNPSRYFNSFMSFIHLTNDGTFLIPLLAHDRTIEEKETHNGVLRTLTELFGPPREPDAEITQNHTDFAAALQAALHACLMHVLRHFKRMTNQENLCLAGGVALNCTANSVVNRSRLFKGLFIQPAAGDDGSALGAALYVQRKHDPDLALPKTALPYLGPAYDQPAIRDALAHQAECAYTPFSSFSALARLVAERIAEGKTVAWFQGRMEFGPRALGNRSILADPRNPHMRDHLNALIKQREDFRPFAPAVTLEAAKQFFDIANGEESLYAHMLFVTQVRESYRSLLPAITHVDGSARVQVVSKQENPRFWTLLNEFETVSGVPVMLNTSFNLRGQPIICTPTQAVNTFLASSIDLLVIGDYLVTR